MTGHEYEEWKQRNRDRFSTNVLVTNSLIQSDFAGCRIRSGPRTRRRSFLFRICRISVGLPVLSHYDRCIEHLLDFDQQSSPNRWDVLERQPQSFAPGEGGMVEPEKVGNAQNINFVGRNKDLVIFLYYDDNVYLKGPGWLSSAPDAANYLVLKSCIVRGLPPVDVYSDSWSFFCNIVCKFLFTWIGKQFPFIWQSQ